LRIAVLTDIHAMDPWMPVVRVERIIETANALNPDLIMFLGDYVAGIRRFRTGIVPISDWSSAFGALRAPLSPHISPSLAHQLPESEKVILAE
jgi:predicted MPP superfamily phosphohydrolase